MKMKPGGTCVSESVISAHAMSFNERCVLGNRTHVRLFMHYSKVELGSLINVK